jgi:hypothetical protein
LDFFSIRLKKYNKFKGVLYQNHKMYINFKPLARLIRKDAQAIVHTYEPIEGDPEIIQQLVNEFLSTRHGAPLAAAQLSPFQLQRFLTNYFGLHYEALKVAEEIEKIPPTPENAVKLAVLYARLSQLNYQKGELLKKSGIPQPVWDNYVHALRIEGSTNPRVPKIFHPLAPINYPKITK